MTSYDKSQENLELAAQEWAFRRVWLPSLGLRSSERRLLLGIVDLILINLALIFSLLISTDLLPSFSAILGPFKWFVTLTAVWFFVANIFDVYNLARAASTTYSVRTIGTVALITSIVYTAIPWLTPPMQNRSQLFLFVFFAIFMLVAWRILYAQFFVQPTFQRRSIIIGTGASGQALVTTLQKKLLGVDANPFRGTGYEILGFIEDNATNQEERVAGLPVLGSSQDVVSVVDKLHIDEVIIAMPNTQHMGPTLFEAILDCRELGVPVTKMTTVYERLTSRVPVEYASDDMEIAAGLDDNPFLRLYTAIKRLTDLIGAVLTLPFLLLLMPLVALGNLFTSPGPLFFKQVRVGRGGRPFHILKFRSMVPDAEKSQGATWAQSNDDRVTVIGRILRWSHLDELPQIINVLHGEMSLVGPRPERPEFVEKLAPRIPFYRARHCAKPGITGWAQIHQDYGDSIASAQEKLEYDLYYVKHISPILDLLIMLRTITKVVGLRGR